MRGGLVGPRGGFVAAGLILALTAGLVLACTPENSGGTAGTGALDLTADEMRDQVAAMLQTSDTLDRNRQLVRLMDSLNHENLPGAIESYEELLSAVDPYEVRLFANAWSKLDSRAAVDRLASWRYPKITNQAVTEAVFVWALHGDPKAARAYVDPKYKGPIEPRRSPSKFMVQAVLEALGVAKEWDLLTDMLSKHEEEGDRELWLTQIVIEINRAHGLDGSREWIESIPWDAPGNLKVSALRRGMHILSGFPNEDSLRWYEDLEGQHEDLVEILPIAARRIIVQDPPAAAEWLLGREETPTRNSTLREVSQSWLERDAEPAQKWIRENFDNDELRGANLLPMVRFLLGAKEYREAAEVARNYGLDGTRETLVAQVLRDWSTLDPNEVDAYIQEMGLSKSTVAQYEEMRANRAIKVNRRRAKKKTETDQ